MQKKILKRQNQSAKIPPLVWNRNKLDLVRMMETKLKRIVLFKLRYYNIYFGALVSALWSIFQSNCKMQFWHSSFDVQDQLDFRQFNFMRHNANP